MIGYKIPGNLLKLASEISQTSQDYKGRAKDRPVVRDNLMLQMGLITILIVFAAVWIGLYLSKRIAIPIRALAEASNEVSQGNLRVQVDCQAQDELEILVHSFNRMTSQLYESSEKAGKDEPGPAFLQPGVGGKASVHGSRAAEHSDGCHFHYFRPQDQPCQQSCSAHVQVRSRGDQPRHRCALSFARSGRDTSVD